MSYHFATPGYNLFRYLKNRELDELYLAMFIKTLARSLILVFIPIYLASLGFSIRFIALFYLLEFIGMAAATPIGLWLNSKIGVKKTMVFADVFFVGYMVAVNAISATGWYIILPTLMFAISGGLFWAGYHVDFTKNADIKDEGKEISFVKSLVVLGSALGPLLGSLLIVGASYTASFIAAAVLISLGALPLLLSKDFKTPQPRFSWPRLKRADDADKARSYIAFGVMQLTNETFWPLFIFLALRSVLDVGLVFTLTSLLIIVALIWFGRRVDARPRQSLIAGVWLHAPSWIARIFFLSPLGFFLSNTYGQLSYQLMDTAFEKVVYSEAKASHDVANYFLFRQIFIGIGRFLVCGLVFLTGSLELAFVFTGIVLFAHLSLAKRLSIRADV
ncbi:MAG: MFS transporter [Candidatus Saccharibacteria bacterium]|jgi:MFS family permease